MSQLQIKTNIENGDLPKKFDDGETPKVSILNKNKFGDYYNRQTILHQWVGRPLPKKDNGQKNK
tara:strand:+ start:236 stop:427 length:192 start_codon:yes stop_codon:yes gene_type:complete